MYINSLSAFFEANLVIVFFVYGLSFFTIAAVIILGFRPLLMAGLGHAFSYLFFFSILHGTVEWIDMYNRYSTMLYSHGISETTKSLRFYMLATSFYFLLLSGLALFRKKGLIKYMHLLFIGAMILLSRGGFAQVASPETEALTRYFLGFPSSLLTGLAFWHLARKKFIAGLPESEYGFFYCISASFILYGFFTGLVPAPSDISPSEYLNSAIFFERTGIPVQVFRALCAFFIANFIVFTMALKVVQRIKLSFFAFFAILFVMAGSAHINLELTSQGYRDVIQKKEEEKRYITLNATFDLIYSLLEANKKGTVDFKAKETLLFQFESTLDDIIKLGRESRAEVLVLEKIRSRIIPAMRDTNRPEDMNIAEFKHLMDRINTLHAKQTESEKKKIEAIYKNAASTKLIVLTLVVLATLYFGRTISRQIIRPLKKLRAGAEEFSTGNLRHRIDINSADEFQEFAEKFNDMAGKLNEMGTRLKELSITDGLTGLYNHRYFYEKLLKEIERSRRYKMELSLLLMDIDNFKIYNDNNGHLEGDALLRSLAEKLKETSRSIDFVCRYGGEEFVIILPQSGREQAIQAAERIRKFVEECSFPGGSNQPLGFVSVSIGVSSYPHDATDPKELTNHADAALYKAKNSGKNRVVSAG